MELSILNISCVSQVALLGSVTPNLRAVSVQFSEKKITIHFFYYQKYSEEEEKETEIVGAKLISNFADCMLEIKKYVHPYPKKNLVKGISVYHRYEPLPENEE